ncbi:MULTISPECIES: HAMP domain-containing protein [Saccharothrix]|uniref:HAMP domain-containing protein n=1 Tax=Saccharothrix TaxID=2071 RepID=UPI00093E5861|nr:HAMP domain-containing protein [Saccharothrix sp. CB00851]OKI27004.1 hypothetical protein A6A25_07100 [Saccharothrix sp. CB00851]
MVVGSAADTRRRYGLRARLVAGTVLVAMCSIAATAWLSVQSTTGMIQAEQGQNQATVARIYDRVLSYAATHPGWDGIAPVLADLSRETGQRIGLTTGNRVPIAGAFGPDDPPLPSTPAAVADPLAVDITLAPRAADDRIDPRAVGPFRLLPTERAQVKAEAEAAARCVRADGGSATVVESASGRSFVRAPGGLGDCDRTGVAEDSPVRKPQATEAQALLMLNSYLDTCFTDRAARGSPALLTGSGGFVRADEGTDQQLFFECLSWGRHLLLTPYVTPAALLFVSGPAVVGLPAAGTTRIVLAAAVVLVLTVGVSMLLARPVLRSLRVLTSATRRMRSGDRAARADVGARADLTAPDRHGGRPGREAVRGERPAGAAAVRRHPAVPHDRTRCDSRAGRGATGRQPPRTGLPRPRRRRRVHRGHAERGQALAEEQRVARDRLPRRR